MLHFIGKIYTCKNVQYILLLLIKIHITLYKYRSIIFLLKEQNSAILNEQLKNMRFRILIFNYLAFFKIIY